MLKINDAAHYEHGRLSDATLDGNPQRTQAIDGPRLYEM